MCGACPGGNSVSKLTATLNRLGLKNQLFAKLKKGLAPGCTLTLAKDQWTLRRRTGRLIVYTDVEHLIADLEDNTNKEWINPQSPMWVLEKILRTTEY